MDATGRPVDDEQEIERVTAEVQSVSSAIDSLTRRLTEANDRLEHVSMVRSSEVEIGRLLLQAQRFVDEAVAEARDHAKATVAEAEAEADRILAEARQQAEEIIQAARSAPTVSPETLLALDTTIGEFTKANTELIHELAQLRDVLGPRFAPSSNGADLPAPTAASDAASNHPTAPSAPIPNGDAGAALAGAGNGSGDAEWAAARRTNPPPRPAGQPSIVREPADRTEPPPLPAPMFTPLSDTDRRGDPAPATAPWPSVPGPPNQIPS